MRRRALIATGVVATAAIAVVGWRVADGADAPRAAADPPAGRVTTVQRRDLVERQTIDGTLGFGGSRTTSSRLQGTLTWLPHEGDVVRSGQRLFAVDGEPVILLDGRMPAWRDLGPGVSDGADVRQLQRALGVTADGEWGWETTEAVQELQERHGLEETGRLELGRVVFLPGARRVAKTDGQLGGMASGPVLTTTTTRPSVEASLDAADQQLARRGMRVDVLLPDGRDVAGRVTEVGRVAQTATGEDGGGDATVDLTVRLVGRAARATRLDQAPVSVELVSERRRDVLAVPATALIGVAGGGYAVQTPTGGQIAVTPGLFADGMVEVSGRSLREGLRVVVPE